MVENGTLLQDRYLIEKQIGAGGMGAVYLAIDQRFGSHVAIKETFYTDDEFGDAFEREAHLLNTLQHPALPHVSDYFSEGEGHFLVMQYIEGEDLSEILKHDGAFPVNDVLRWTDSLLDALDYLHSQEPPIIHRDIKPQNLKITPRGDVILLDFGLAKLKAEDTSSMKSIFGYSRKYSPLEQIQGTGTDAHSDIFSLGATAYHLLTGKPPIDVLARAAEIVAGNPDPLPLASEIDENIPVPVAKMLNTALALNPASRFDTAKSMQRALDGALSDISGERTEELPKAILAAISNDKADPSHDEEDFPALEAFASESAVSQFTTEEYAKPEAVEIPTATIHSAETSVENSSESNSVVEAPTKIAARRSTRSRFPVAALVVVLLLVGLAAGYFINKSQSSANSINADTQSIPAANSNSKQAESVSNTPMPEEQASQDSDNVEQDEAKSSSSEKNVEEKEKSEEPIVKEERAEKREPVSKEAPKSSTERNVPRSQPKGNGETRERVVENERLPDIETVFTGRPPRYRNERLRRQNERARRNNEMREEEWEDFRRERRRERRRRQNNRPPPF